MDYPMVIVEWLDSWFQYPPSGEDNWDAECPMATVGFLVRDDKNVVSVAGEIIAKGDYDERFRGITHIPRAVVKSVTTLTPSQADQMPACSCGPCPGEPDGPVIPDPNCSRHGAEMCAGCTGARVHPDCRRHRTPETC